MATGKSSKAPPKEKTIKTVSTGNKKSKTVSSSPVKKTAVKKKAVAKEKTTGKTVVSKTIGLKKITFQLAFHTEYGQELFITGDHPLLGNGIEENAVSLQYFNQDYWWLVLDVKKEHLVNKDISYHYVLRNPDGTVTYDACNDKIINLAKIKAEELLVIDSWNHAGFIENSFYTEPFAKVLLKDNRTKVAAKLPAKITHTLKVKAPLLTKGQTLCLLSSSESMGNWATEKPLLLSRKETEDFYTISLDLSKESFPIAYKYGVYDTVQKQFICYEEGNNRVLYDISKDNRQVILNDGFAMLSNSTWKGAGIAIPVFSLRTEKSFGIGEFADLPLLVDWAKATGLQMIQLLPVNDTTATHSWTDSYPYAAISAFALHPIYLNLEKISSPAARKRLKQLEKERRRLNALPVVDHETVARIKREYISAVYKEDQGSLFETKEYKEYFEQNKHWLVPYAAFCYLRDQYGTVDFNKWPAYKKYDAKEIEQLTSSQSGSSTGVGMYYFIQYHLHIQLKEATAYAHSKGVIVKGDIAIGVYRYGADAWRDPDLYHLGFQAGAPPDDFAVKGQNWGFPTYNWQRMRENGYNWWKLRFAQMNDYFDAFRIDHILGFFRIWSIPIDAVEGIMGHYVPAIPVHINEFNSKAIWFDHARYTRPFITEDVLWELFGYDNELVKSLFLEKGKDGNYHLKPGFATQRLIEQHFAALDHDDHHHKIQQGLYNLVSNIILFEAEGSNGLEFHFRFDMEKTSSFRNLSQDTQAQLHNLYIDYFYRRQEELLKKEALQKLPAIKRVTNMLVCGEDLGLVPACVPDVMRQLGLLSLEIQRMPKDAHKEFFHPNDAPYLSVVTPSTHDMSTVRGWWEEDREQVQRFYHHELGQDGEAPSQCEAWINKAIVLQHLYSPAMWSVFQLQDLLGMSESLRRKDPREERINIPANPKHYWQYRMHLTIEQLLKEDAFNDELKGYVKLSGRI